jgi:hypothetical protein
MTCLALRLVVPVGAHFTPSRGIGSFFAVPDEGMGLSRALVW